MKRLLVYSLALAMLGGCATGLWPTGAPVHPGTQHFAYTIDPAIAGRYGAGEDVAWSDAGEGRRPSIWVLDDTTVTFEAGTTEAERERFFEAFPASATRRQVIPPPPGSDIPPMPTDTYVVTFAPDGVSLDGLDAFVEATDFQGGWVFSSERAAKIFYQIMRARHEKERYGIRFIGFNFMLCIPEDCGPDEGPVPAYPSFEPRPSPTPTPTPPLRPMAIADFTCRERIPLGKVGLVTIEPLAGDGCWAPHEVRAVLDQERFEVRLEATEKQLADCGGDTPEVHATFHPKVPGTYTVTATIHPDGPDGARQTRSCEIVVEDHP